MPSTDWKETILADETERFDALAAQLRDVQRQKAKETGSTLRALHAKGHLGLKAELTPMSGLPDWARVGVFASTTAVKGWVRFSNGTSSVQSDRRPDIRGMALKLTGVGGKKLIPGMENALTHDFLAILSPAVPFPNAEGFVALVRAANGPKVLALPRVLASLGFQTFRILGQLQKELARPVESLTEEIFYSALPIRWGTAAVKFCFAPLVQPKPSGPLTSEDTRLADDLRARVTQGALRWKLRIQPFTSEAETPIEDPTKVWSSAFLDVAELVIHRQDPTSDAGRAVQTQVESFSFDPWHAPEEFRPLGAMMRARGHAYRDSVVERKAAPEPGPEHW